MKPFKQESIVIRPVAKFCDTYGLDRFPLAGITITANFYRKQAIKRRMYLCLGVEIDTRNCN